MRRSLANVFTAFKRDFNPSAYLKENPLYVGWNSHALYECVHTHTSTKTNKVVWYC